MALLRPKEIRVMRPEDIRAKFKELNDELMHERGVAAMGGAPRSPGKIRALRTNIARIHTIMQEMQTAKTVKASGAPAKMKAEAKEGPKKAPEPRAKKARKEKSKKEEQEEKK